MMLKQILFAVAPMLLLSGSAFADDALLSSIAKLESPTSVQTPSDPADAYGKADVDALVCGLVRSRRSGQRNGVEASLVHRKRFATIRGERSIERVAGKRNALWRKR